MLIADILNEAASAPLYHGTTWEAACEILRDGGFLGLTGHLVNGKAVHGLSATRSPRFSHIDYEPDARYGESGNNVKAFNVLFVLNQDAIRRRFGVHPVDYYKGKETWKSSWDQSAKLRDRRAESEEFIAIGTGRTKLPLKGNVSKIVYYPNSFSDPEDEPSSDDYLAFVQMAVRFSIPVVIDRSDFQYGYHTRDWTKQNHASLVRYPDKNEVRLGDDGTRDWDQLTSFMQRWRDAGSPADDQQVADLYTPGEHVALWGAWLRLNNRPHSLIPAKTPINAGTLKALFRTLSQADPKTKVAYRKIMPFRPATPPPAPAKHNGGAKRDPNVPRKTAGASAT